MHSDNFPFLPLSQNFQGEAEETYHNFNEVPYWDLRFYQQNAC